MVGIGIRNEWHNEMDHYGILGLPKTATKEEIRKKYKYASLQCVQDRVVGRGQKWTEERGRIWNDIKMAYDVLSDERLKQNYDRDIANLDLEFQCSYCNEKTTRRTATLSKSSFHFYCSQLCDDFSIMGDYPNGAVYSNWTGKNYTPPTSTEGVERTCPSCSKTRKLPPEAWKKYRETDPDTDYCCSSYCLGDLLTVRRVNFDKCAFCPRIKTFNSRGWVKENGEIYCSEDHYWDSQNIGLGGLGFGGEDEASKLLADKTTAITEIENTLNQDPPIVVTELESTNQNWRIEIQNAPNSGAIGVIKDRVLADISQKRAAKGGNSVLDDRKKVAITKIKGELAQDPVVQNSELESTNQGWENAIQTAANETIVNQIETQVLNDIQTKRSAKDPLAKLQSAAINQILDELVSQEPSVDESEITNRNWEGDIISAKSESEINRILQETLAEIRKKRASQQETDLLSNLLLQAKAPQNWDNYQNLENILQQIKKLRSSNIYQTKISEIQAIEDRLHELDPNQYQETVEKSLDQQLKNNNLTEGDLDHETKQAMVEAKQDPTSKTKKKEAEDKIAVCGARKELTAILNKADRVQGDPTKKNELITQILDFLVKNSFTLQAYNERRTAVDHLLNKLIQGDSSNQQNPEFPWLKVLGISAAIFFPLVLISFLVLKTRQSGRGKKK